MLNAKSPIIPYIDLINDLRALLNHVPYPFTKVDSKYLEAEVRWHLLEIAEYWAINHSYIDKSGKWVQQSDRLAAFLDILIRERILNKSLGRNEIGAYFTNRYQCDPLTDQLKPSKIKRSEKGMDFTLLTALIRNPLNSQDNSPQFPL